MEPREVSQIVYASLGVELLMQTFVNKSETDHALKIRHLCHQLIVFSEAHVHYLYNHALFLLLHVVLHSVAEHFLSDW